MTSYKELVIASLLIAVASGLGELDFPPGFKFGAATASYQVEGGWNASDKSPNIWDTFTRRPGVILDGTNGDVACDSYHLWERDIEIAKEMGLHFYRFSISWSRLLPSGFANKISEDGKNYYNNLINGLLAAGIEPRITLYHWDLPQSLQNLGGWTNPLIADWFADYARVIFSLYGDRVKTWITINEPVVLCSMGYGVGTFAPGTGMPEFADYICNKHVLLAHAKAWRMYDEEFRSTQKGKIGITNLFMWMEPDTEEDEELTELIRQYSYGIYLNPIYSKEGGWPPAVEEAIAKKSKEQGYTSSRLPPFTDEEKEFIRGTYDFLGFNHYSGFTVRKQRPGEASRPYLMSGAPEFDVIFGFKDHWTPTASSWFRVNPEGIRKALNYLRKNYGNVEFFISESGYSAGDEEEDVEKVKYYANYLAQVLLAIKEDGINVSAYTAWTLIDNFEWVDGYTRMFGLYKVDFESPQRTRTPRDSARYYAEVIKAHSLNIQRPNTTNPIRNEL